MLYLALKLVHIAAVMMFLGNIVMGLFWKRNADRTRDPRVIVNAIEGIIRSDRLFTIPGVVLIVAAGVTTAIVGGVPILRTGWILWAIVLFAISGGAFGAQVAPLQRRLLAAAREGVSGGSEWWERYERLSRRWEAWGAVALLAPLGAMALMVMKPVLPGL